MLLNGIAKIQTSLNPEKQCQIPGELSWRKNVEKFKAGLPGSWNLKLRLILKQRYQEPVHFNNISTSLK